MGKFSDDQMRAVLLARFRTELVKPGSISFQTYERIARALGLKQGQVRYICRLALDRARFASSDTPK